MLPSSAARAATVDAAARYEDLRRELVAVVRAARPDELDRVVAATPAWRVRDVLAHVTGITVDLNRQEFGPGGPDAWTAAQVERHRDDPVDVVVAEWDAEAPAFEEGLRLFGYPLGAHYVADLHAHLQDVRSTLDLPPHDDPETVLVALDFYLESLDEALRRSGAGALTVVAGDEVHRAGAGEPTATVRGSPFEILRALSGRRSPTQVRALDWSGAADALAHLISSYPPPGSDLPA